MKQAVIIGLCLFLGACGFRPLYGDAHLSPQLASIFVDPVANTDGYELRNTLIDLLGSDGRTTGKAYRLHLVLSETSQGIAQQGNATITRFNDTLTVNYVLTNSAGAEIVHGSQTGLASFNVATSPYTTFSQQRDSNMRAAQDIAVRIRLDLSVYFSQRR